MIRVTSPNSSLNLPSLGSWTRQLVLVLATLSLIAPAQAQRQGVQRIKQADVPIVITSPGSYQLVGNLVVSDPNTTAITISADNVTLDLNGFAILGPGIGPVGAGSGIDVTVQNQVLVKNGSVRGFFDPAAACVHLPGFSNRVEDVSVDQCPQQAIFVGQNGLVRGCQVTNSGVGIGSDHGSAIQGNTLFLNGVGIQAQGDGGVSIVNNNLRENSIGVSTASAGAGRNQIQGNLISAGGTGIDLSSSANNYFAANVLQGNLIGVAGDGDDVDGASVDPALANVVVP